MNFVKMVNPLTQKSAESVRWNAKYCPLVLCAAFVFLPVLGWSIDSATAQEAGLQNVAQRSFRGSAATKDSDVDLFPSITSLSPTSGGADSEPVTWDARYYANPDGKGVLEVEANLSTHWHIYSVTQPKGGPTRTRIELRGPDEVKLNGEFSPDKEPTKSISSVYDGLTVEEHDGTVVWSAPLKLPSNFSQSIEVSVRGLACVADDEDGRCMPVNDTVLADFAGTVQQRGNASTVAFQQAPADAAAGPNQIQAKPFRDGKYVVEWTAQVVPPALAAGKSGVIRFTAKPDREFHVYRVAIDDSESATNFVVTEKAGLLIGKPTANKEAVAHSILPDLPPVHYYKGDVSFDLPIQAPKDVTDGLKTIKGMIAYQACTDKSCHKPVALKFTAQVPVGNTDAQPQPIQFASAKSAEALDAAKETKWVDPIAADDKSADADDGSDANGVVGSNTPPKTPLSGTGYSFAAMLGFAFLGGLILNIMPCVLPVVGLKIMGFVSQAGEDRRRIMLLNVVYALGIMSVFAILAGIAAVSKFGWGEQFTYFEVKLGLAILMFALALSYLGVWEIPAPGMAGGKTSAELQNREGLTGAFSKGVFATILSTPCSGPLLGYILAATLNYSPFQTIVIMLTVGFGMASPYLLIGAQPKLVSWLPKPGPWMETFKQAMAFLFLGTVAYFFAQFSDEHKVPVFITLIAVWFGCWIIGQVPNWASFRKRLAAWTTGVAAASLISIGAFHYLKPNDQLNWIDYSEPTLVSLQNEGKTVLLDFSAKWCATCQVNYAVAINTEETREVLDELGGVAMYADWTDQSEEIKNKLEELDSRSIPLLAIYPGGRPDNPIVLRDVVTQQQVIDALREAGASQNARTTPDGSPVSVAVSR